VQYVVYLGTLLAIASLWQSGPRYAFVRVYLPVLLLLPDCYRAVTPGLPDPSFNQATIIPIFLAALWLERARWRPSISDGLMLCFALTVAYSELSNTGYNDAQNLMFAMIASVVAPYMCARLLLHNAESDRYTARIFVQCCVLVTVLSVYQFRFGINLWHLWLGPFFPGQGTGWVTTFRHGFARIAGPYSHAILAGIILAIAWRLARWLQWAGHWEPRLRALKLPGKKSDWINGSLLAGILMTVARGPWLGGLAGGVFMWISHGRMRSQRLWCVVAFFAVALIGGNVAMDAYLEVKPGAIMTQSQESAIYRKELMEKYQTIAVEHAWLGWGRNTWPKVGGMESIDNYYLLLALMHGLLALGLLVMLMAWMLIRLLRRGLQEAAGAASLSFTFASIIIMVFISLGTVYLGEQVMPAFFLVLGWPENFLQRAMTPTTSGSPVISDRGKPGFRNVML